MIESYLSPLAFYQKIGKMMIERNEYKGPTETFILGQETLIKNLNNLTVCVNEC